MLFGSKVLSPIDLIKLQGKFQVLYEFSDSFRDMETWPFLNMIAMFQELPLSKKLVKI